MKYEVNQAVLYQDDSERDDEETHQHQGRIDAEGALYLVVAHAELE